MSKDFDALRVATECAATCNTVRRSDSHPKAVQIAPRARVATCNGLCCKPFPVAIGGMGRAASTPGAASQKARR